MKVEKSFELRLAQYMLNAEAREGGPSTYQPITGHGYGPHQLEEMKRFAAQMKPAR